MHGSDGPFIGINDDSRYAQDCPEGDPRTSREKQTDYARGGVHVSSLCCHADRSVDWHAVLVESCTNILRLAFTST